MKVKAMRVRANKPGELKDERWVLTDRLEKLGDQMWWLIPEDISKHDDIAMWIVLSTQLRIDKAQV